MDITFIGHASILIETRGVRVLSDPWWRGPCFGAQWWNYPPPYLDPVQTKLDYIYISHGHHDHLHPGTLLSLKKINPNVIILVSKNINIADSIRKLGFNVVEIEDSKDYLIAENTLVRIAETCSSDTLFTIDDGENVCVNLNDALHAAPKNIQDHFIRLLASWHPQIDYVFCGYGIASHFPNCYQIPGRDPESTTSRRQAYFNRSWTEIMGRLKPRFGFPFAANVVFLEEDLLWTNEPTHNSERPTDVFQASHSGLQTRVLDIAPGFQISDKKISRAVYRQPLSLTQLQNEYTEEIKRANKYGTVTKYVFDENMKLVRNNVQKCLHYLQEYKGNYRFLIRFRNHLNGISIIKINDDITISENSDSLVSSYDLIYITRAHYLKSSLTSKYGNEILFVGSGGIFEYTDNSKVKLNLHRELTEMLKSHDSPPISRYGDNSHFMYWLKQKIKALLGQKPANISDLYDLEAWTVWQKDLS